VFFGPGAGMPPRFRFDAPKGEFQTLHVGLSYEAALVETLLRNPRRRTVDRLDVEIRSMAVLTNESKLRLVEAHGSALAQIGTTAAISTGPYNFSRRWALELWSHTDRPDGIVYLSRHKPALLCAAIFDRPHAIFAMRTAPLRDDPHSVAAVFEAHGKSLA
jgi:hypothetical protein